MSRESRLGPDRAARSAGPPAEAASAAGTALDPASLRAVDDEAVASAQVLGVERAGRAVALRLRLVVAHRRDAYAFSRDDDPMLLEDSAGNALHARSADIEVSPASAAVVEAGFLRAQGPLEGPLTLRIRPDSHTPGWSSRESRCPGRAGGGPPENRQRNRRVEVTIGS